MLANWQDTAHMLRNPSSGRPLSGDVESKAATGVNPQTDIDFVQNQPVLVRRDSPFLDYDAIVESHAASQIERTARFKRLRKLRRRIGRSGDGLTGEIPVLKAHLNAVENRKPTILIVGGGTVGVGVDELINSKAVSVISFDVYASKNTSFVGDAHDMMLEDSSVDAVWIQAVLEHVQDPVRVVGEIERVLRPNGLVLAETPFLQPVHEGPFDFTRYTLSGHRILFANFSEISSGPIGGPGAMMALALRGLGGGLARSRSVEAPIYMLGALLASLDRFVALPWRRDFATGCFFVGSLSTDPERVDPVSIYEGRQK